jgi:hypothetical protein
MSDHFTDSAYRLFRRRFEYAIDEHMPVGVPESVSERVVNAYITRVWNEMQYQVERHERDARKS